MVTQLLRWQALIDLLALTLAIYFALSWARRARALRIVLLLLALYAASVVARQFEVIITSWVLEGAAVVVLVVLVLAFQAEVRYAVMRLESGLRFWPPATPSIEPSMVIAKTAFALAGSRIGSLIVIVRKNPVNELINGGVLLGASISQPLLESIFQKESPLHDGAVVIEAARVVRAGAYLPLANRRDLPLYFGTRHRAAIGLAERCDALVVVSSEERGEVSLMQGHTATLITAPEALADALERGQVRTEAGLQRGVAGVLFANLKYKLAALGLALGIWIITFLLAGTALRSFELPLEFSRLPGDMEIATYSADHLDVQLRGNTWILDSMATDRPLVHVNLAGTKAGANVIRVRAGDISLPPGVTVASITPPRITVTLAKRP
ncbi:MAG TPA: diadenylate cyclase [Bryobacteraceae bacterium]|nr:diadenylate cyclase [Bryobacteraceae bacterium]